ncbi:MAG: S-layer homology domain-containing protein, partial [Patescibacteria group bacterium]
PDTDGDSINDGDENEAGTDPLVNEDDEDGQIFSPYTPGGITVSPLPDITLTPIEEEETVAEEETPAEEETVVDEETPAEEETVVDEEEEEEVAEEETEDEDVVTVLDQDCIDPFVDTEGHWAEIKVCELYVQDVVDGKFTNLYVPNDYMTRAEFLKVLLGAAGFDEGDAGGLTESYTDVSSSDWYYSWIAMAENEGILRNQGGAYRPNEPITRADAAVLTVRLAGLTLYGYTASDIAYFDVKTTDYFAYAVILASDEVVMVEGEGEQSVIEGYSDGSFRPYSYMTRAEVATMLLRAQLAWF